MDEYQTAQRAVADLKAAVLSHLRGRGPATNAEVGRSLGIYFGHVRHEGHVSRSILQLLADEGLVRQSSKGGPWEACQQ
jgi:hypothetical protein